MLLRADSLSKLYRRRRVVDGVRLWVDSAEVVGLFGRNGAGKTTTLRMLAGLVGIDEGTVEFQDRDITSLPVDRRSRLGLTLVPHEDSVFRRLTVRDNLLAIDRACRSDALLAEYGLEDVADRKAGTLDGGARRRLLICRAMVTAPTVLMLDEPFSGVDPMLVLGLMRLIRNLPRRGISVLFADHNVRESLPLCDRAYIMHEGRVLTAGTPGDLLSG
jgi:lipopolysaccharide export system ATP-binding protein